MNYFEDGSPWDGDFSDHYWADDEELEAREDRRREEAELDRWEAERDEY